MPAGQAIDREPPEGAGPRSYGASGDGPVAAVVRLPEREGITVPDAMIELAIDFTGEKRR